MKSFIKILLNSLRKLIYKDGDKLSKKKFKILNDMVKEYDIYSNVTNIILTLLVFSSGGVLVL